MSEPIYSRPRQCVCWHITYGHDPGICTHQGTRLVHLQAMTVKGERLTPIIKVWMCDPCADDVERKRARKVEIRDEDARSNQ